MVGQRINGTLGEYSGTLHVREHGDKYHGLRVFWGSSVLGRELIFNEGQKRFCEVTEDAKGGILKLIFFLSSSFLRVHSFSGR